jgi:hypothetical protein
LIRSAIRGAAPAPTTPTPIVDTSLVPSIGAVNPPLTAIADAVRVGDHVPEHLG